jgi:peptidoglycan/LPS O-acetylase OafA/YrhL
MAVLLYHIRGFVVTKADSVVQAAPTLFERLLTEGSYGVPLFFALSGYILCRPFLGGRKVSLKRYFTRRLSRLEPPYLISLIVVFVAKIWVLDLTFAGLLPNLAASLVYSHNLIYGTHSTVNGVTWSLEIEWQFYLLAPLIFGVVARSIGYLRHMGLLALIGLGGWAFVAGVDADPRIGLSLLRYFGFFAAGVWVAVLDEEHPTFGLDSFSFDLLGIAAWIGVFAALLRGRSFNMYLPALTALVILSGVRGNLFRKVLGWWPIYCVGAMCYTIYLYHFFIVSAIGRAFSGYLGWPGSIEIALLLFSLVAVPVVVAMCVVPYLLIERPFMVWRPGRNRLIDAFRKPA